MFKFPLVTPIFLDFNNLNHARFFFQHVGPEAEVLQNLNYASMVLLFWVNATSIHKIYMVHCELGDMVQDVELLPKL